MYSRDEMFLRSLGCFLCLFPSLLRNSVNKYRNNPLVGAETVRHSSTYIILYISTRQIVTSHVEELCGSSHIQHTKMIWGSFV